MRGVPPKKTVGFRCALVPSDNLKNYIEHIIKVKIIAWYFILLGNLKKTGGRFCTGQWEFRWDTVYSNLGHCCVWAKR